MGSKITQLVKIMLFAKTRKREATFYFFFKFFNRPESKITHLAGKIPSNGSKTRFFYSILV
jgi:hypothetical protein